MVAVDGRAPAIIASRATPLTAGVLFLQEVKGYLLATATQVISVNALLGIVGMVSYVGAGLQDIVSGWLINSGKTVTDGVTTYDFDTAIVFWIAASALSFILALFVSKKSHVKSDSKPI